MVPLVTWHDSGRSILKRSNRLVLLIGVLLAVIAFIGIIVLTTGGGGGGIPGEPAEVTKAKTVISRVAIPLGVEVTEAMLKVEEVDLTLRPATAFGETAVVVGKIARTNINAGQTLTAADFDTGSTVVQIDTPPGLRAIAIQVDQVSGVGTVIRAGDIVDMLVGFKFEVVTVDPDDDSITVVAGLNGNSVKLLVQGMQVLGTLLPPPPVDAQGQPVVNEDGTALTGQQEIVIVAATAQQAEIIKFAQLDGSISLVLRSPDDFERDENGLLLPRVPDATTGVILKTLIDEHGVLIPQLVETILPGPVAQ